MNTIPGLTGVERALVCSLLAEHLPLATRVQVFGSRATARWKQFSDLDLAIDAGEPLSPALHAALTEAFGESDLPWKVDIVDCQTVSPQFAAIIATTAAPLEWQAR